MANRNTLTIEAAMPEHEVTIELPPIPEKTASHAEPQSPPKVAETYEPFVDIPSLWERYWEAKRRGWADKAVDIEQTIKWREEALIAKQRAVTALTFRQSQTRSTLSPFVILVSRNEQFRVEHLNAGLALLDLLSANTAKYATWPGMAGLMGGETVANRATKSASGRRLAPTSSFKPKGIKASKTGGDGGMARMADDVRLKARIWSAFVAAAESAGEALSGKPRFGDVCVDVIRNDSTLVEACKAHIRMRQSKARNVAVSSMVAGLDAIIPMFANRK